MNDQDLLNFNAMVGLGNHGVQPSAWDQFSGLFDGFFTQEGPGGQPIGGWGLNALNAGNGLLQSWLGFQQLGMAQDQFDFQKNAWNAQYNDNKTMLNTQMADRQAARYAANPLAYQDPATYMAQNKIGG